MFFQLKVILFAVFIVCLDGEVRYPRSCKELQQIIPDVVKDGSYWFSMLKSPHDIIPVYCHAMDTSNPLEYLSISKYRLIGNGFGAPMLNNSSPACTHSTNKPPLRFTQYTKLRLDIQTSLIITNDSTFAIGGGSVLEFGSVRPQADYDTNCFSLKFEYDVTGAGFVFNISKLNLTSFGGGIGYLIGTTVVPFYRSAMLPYDFSMTCYGNFSWCGNAGVFQIYQAPISYLTDDIKSSLNDVRVNVTEQYRSSSFVASEVAQSGVLQVLKSISGVSQISCAIFCSQTPQCGSYQYDSQRQLCELAKERAAMVRVLHSADDEFLSKLL